MTVPVIEQARVQAQVLVPLVKALQAELGEAKANRLVRRAMIEIALPILRFFRIGLLAITAASNHCEPRKSPGRKRAVLDAIALRLWQAQRAVEERGVSVSLWLR